MTYFLYLDILLTENISRWYSIIFILHHIGKCIMPQKNNFSLKYMVSIRYFHAVIHEQSLQPWWLKGLLLYYEMGIITLRLLRPRR